MNQVLLNIALFGLTGYCKAQGIDCAGSHVVKDGRGFGYSLLRTATGEVIAKVRFSRHNAPAFWHPVPA